MRVKNRLLSERRDINETARFVRLCVRLRARSDLIHDPASREASEKRPERFTSENPAPGDRAARSVNPWSSRSVASRKGGGEVAGNYWEMPFRSASVRTFSFAQTVFLVTSNQTGPQTRFLGCQPMMTERRSWWWGERIRIRSEAGGGWLLRKLAIP